MKLKHIGIVLAGIAGLLLASELGSWALGLVSSASNMDVFVGICLLMGLGAMAMGVSRPIAKAIKAVLVLMVMMVMTGCGSTIQPGHAGIVVNAYGSNRGVQDYTVSTGRVWYNPMTTQVFEYPTFVQNVVFTANPSEGKAMNEEITFTNADQMAIAADVAIAYSLKIDKLPAFYVKFRSDDLSQFTYGYLHSLLRDKFNDIAGHYTISQIMGDNGPFLKEVKSALQKELDPIGVQLESQFGFIGAPRPPKLVIDSINLKAQASQLAIQKQNELVQVQADAAKAIAKAEGDARATTAWAQAQADANRKIADSLTPNLVEVKRLEKWDGHLPQVNGGSTPFVSLSSAGK